MITAFRSGTGQLRSAPAAEAPTPLPSSEKDIIVFDYVHLDGCAWRRIQSRAGAGSQPRPRLPPAAGAPESCTETDEAVSVVLDVPAELREAFRYRAGQFVTFRVGIDGVSHLRSYSMSSSPDVDAELQVTVKRVPGGAVSTWMTDSLRARGRAGTTQPAGIFTPGFRQTGELVAFAGGSGITPVFSLIKSGAGDDRLGGCGCSTRTATRDRDLRRAELDTLAERHPGRLAVRHHFDIDGRGRRRGRGDAVRRLGRRHRLLHLRARTVHGSRRDGAAGRRRRPRAAIHIERFGPAEDPQRRRAAARRRHRHRHRRAHRDHRAGRPHRDRAAPARGRRSCRPPARWA